MKTAKRIFLFALVNILIVISLSILLHLLGISPKIGGKELGVVNLATLCLIYGFGASLASLALSRVVAKWMMGVRVIDPEHSASIAEQELLEKVYRYSRQAGLLTMPEVGIYESPDLNAFATGPTQNRALVAVSTGLLQRMDGDGVDGVLAHEVAHVANGDMVTMTLVQGVVNAFVMFLARTIAWFAGQFLEEDKRPMVQFGIVLAMEIGLGLLGMLVVARVSRAREFRADEGGAALAGPSKMIAALRGLKYAHLHGSLGEIDDGQSRAITSLKISGKTGGYLRLLSTHPDLDERINRIEQMRLGKRLQVGRTQVFVSG